MCLCNRNLFVSHAQGRSAINLKNLECRLVVEHADQPCVLARFGTDVLFTNQAKASIWQLSGNGELSLFAGSDTEDGSSDGPGKESRFKRPVGICSEFDSVVYVCDVQTNTIDSVCLSITNIHNTVEFCADAYRPLKATFTGRLKRLQILRSAAR